MSSGYVADMAKIPAPAPAVRRVRGPSCTSGSDSRAPGEEPRFEGLICEELGRGVGDDADAVGAVALEHADHSLGPHDVRQPRQHAVVRGRGAPRHLLQDLEALERRDRGARDPPATPPATSDLQISINPTPGFPSPADGATNPPRA